ncbi:uncharacterized protein VTP21DRAFT_10194 [Calcarisporiella thermophila]|uniref:uncharacterized protein n=1 Tax=Calcarisporiella thermophila TaxID=911321 RepID=UPI003743BEF5
MRFSHSFPFFFLSFYFPPLPKLFLTHCTFPSSLFRKASLVKTMSLVSQLEYYRTRIEAAKSFEDDMEFNPALTADELAELRKELSDRVAARQAAFSAASMSSPTMVAATPTSTVSPGRRAIPILDPSNKAPVTLPSRPASRTGIRPRSPPYRNFSGMGSPTLSSAALAHGLYLQQQQQTSPQHSAQQAQQQQGFPTLNSSTSGRYSGSSFLRQYDISVR